MDYQEILCDDIDVVVFGEGNEEFALRMFKKDSKSFLVTDWCDIRMITCVISTDHLFMHFNFYFIQEQIFEEAIEILKKDIYLGIVTYLLDDVVSFEKSGELYDKYIQDSVVPPKNIPGRIGICHSSILPHELNLINLWNKTENHQIIQAGIKAAVCNERKASILMKENREGVLKHVKFITKSEESPFIEEKQDIFIWMFENYIKKNKKFDIPQYLIEELRNSFKASAASSCSVS